MRELYRIISVAKKNCYCIRSKCVLRYDASLFPKGIVRGSSVMAVNHRFELFHGTIAMEDGSYMCRQYGGRMFYRRKPLSINEIVSLVEAADTTLDPSLLQLLSMIVYDDGALHKSQIDSELSTRIDCCIVALMRKEGCYIPPQGYNLK